MQERSSVFLSRCHSQRMMHNGDWNSHEFVVSLSYQVDVSGTQLLLVMLRGQRFPAGFLASFLLELLWDLLLVVSSGGSSGESSNAFGGFSRGVFQR